MLKVLRVISWAAAVSAVVGVAGLGLLWKCGEGQILDFLRRPGVVQGWQAEHPGQGGDLPYHRLELAVIAFGQSLKKPEPIFTPVVEREKDVNDPRIRDEKIVISDPPPPPPLFQYQLVGTFVAENASARSMALIEVSKGRFEWIEPGQYLGNHRLGDISPRRTVLIDGTKRKELVMPPKPPIAPSVSGWRIE